MGAKHSGLGRGFGEFFQRTDLDDDDDDIPEEEGDFADAAAEDRVQGSPLMLTRSGQMANSHAKSLTTMA